MGWGSAQGLAARYRRPLWGAVTTAGLAGGAAPPLPAQELAAVLWSTLGALAAVQVRLIGLVRRTGTGGGQCRHQVVTITALLFAYGGQLCTEL